ncbi:hypothetical protein [Roseibacillus ishigakijimensis]|uniref:Uncharacterized protein n=1 Tax=Roseibacillus ishigakijimensis TaxID=454146 RepID=A0A934VNC4_9BACT|nr:hypothetical protein [Roseibacillus ishigakijimensis]MBK1835157.1 hypothetical protein [Roseibacillus ishigakijimensis]
MRKGGSVGCDISNQDGDDAPEHQVGGPEAVALLGSDGSKKDKDQADKKSYANK